VPTGASASPQTKNAKRSSHEIQKQQKSDFACLAEHLFVQESQKK